VQETELYKIPVFLRNFCRPTDDRARSLEVFNIINLFLEDNERKWEKCIELCVDGT
jgi:hypothetical protein